MLGLFTFVLTVFSAAALVSLLALHGNARKLFCGLGATIFSIIMYASPLSIMRLVIKTKSVEFMPFFLSLFVFLCGTSWFVFGLLGRDAFIAVTCFADPKWFWVWAGVDAAHPLLHLSQEQRIPVPLPTKLLRWNMRNMQMEKMNMFNWGVKEKPIQMQKQQTRGNQRKHYSDVFIVGGYKWYIAYSLVDSTCPVFSP
ncbi:hypothetical protein V6N13_040495 [Hibiscus sabdariffa]|uniref:Bidirectional sugar transporter SWEET n=1 Tax=Hibiscus sabdariffa TaxID=183260 RepID=A0ABR2R8K9_9ROSI